MNAETETTAQLPKYLLHTQNIRMNQVSPLSVQLSESETMHCNYTNAK